ncbi:hypothetical protein FOZ61_002689 [Perkinsus olseni]|uniref:Uncharacterized protein n=1 Tax=Perkinsus olseni TaxID=32597 RepID=A0A7J6LSL1_PEROL|nr:hypothetical protein FOZ61_002689 [Perkinsus olseni]
MLSLPLSIALLFAVGSEGANELANSCYFTYTLAFHWCDPSREGCDQGHRIRAADFQLKAERFYAGLGPPPLEEVYYITGLPDQFQEDLLTECPAMLILAYMVVAEIRLRLGEVRTSASFWAQAHQFLAELESSAAETMMESWPILEAQRYYEASVLEIREAQYNQTQGAPLGIVVAHCKEDISWLHQDFAGVIPVGSDLAIYEKCDSTTDYDPYLPLFSSVQIRHLDDGDTRQDECSAYLTYIVSNYGNFPRHILFLQGDALKHASRGLLRLILVGVSFGTVKAQFVHLNSQRLVSAQTKCRKAIYEQVFGVPLEGKLSTYCCAQFLVASSRITARAVDFYEKMARIMNEASPGECSDIVGHSTHCLIYESLWHVVFGEPPALPRRVEDASLPAFLRPLEEEAESFLPRGSK